MLKVLYDLIVREMCYSKTTYHHISCTVPKEGPLEPLVVLMMMSMEAIIIIIIIMGMGVIIITLSIILCTTTPWVLNTAVVSCICLVVGIMSMVFVFLVPQAFPRCFPMSFFQRLLPQKWPSL